MVKEYIASDRYENLKLLQRNLQENGLISPPTSPKQRKRELATTSEESVISTSTSTDIRSLKYKGKGKETKENPSQKGKGKVNIEEIDWEVVSKNRQRRLNDLFKYNVKEKVKDMDGVEKTERTDLDLHLDLILAVDCIYNESLVIPLIDTFCEYAKRGKTVVWVAVELRSSDVVSGSSEPHLELSKV